MVLFIALALCLIMGASCGGSSSPTAPSNASTTALDQSFAPLSGQGFFTAPVDIARAQTFTVGVTGMLTGADVMVVAVSVAPVAVQVQSDIPVQVQSTTSGSCFGDYINGIVPNAVVPRRK